MNYFFEDNIQINENISEIDIKILNNKYEINLNKIIRKTHFVTTYEGIDISDNNKIIVDKYNTNILTLCKKILNNIITLSHPNIIIIIDIIIEKHIPYIIKKYHQTNINNDLIKNNYIDYFRQIFNGVFYLFTKNINIETLYINNIFIENNKVIISPYFGEDKLEHKNILYGSPLYSPPELFNKYIPEKESIIVWNLGIIFYQLLFNKNPFENCKEYNDIFDVKLIELNDLNDFYDSEHLNDYNVYNDYNEFIDILTKMIDTNKNKRSTINDVKNFFDNYKNNKCNNKNDEINTDIFQID